ncbi:MAG TPA: beta-propeller fold lactonase family protein [Candidatus Sulfotelmatobacter sp.]
MATTPVVTVTSPAPGAQVSSPINFVASASSPNCASGIAAMRIYAAPGDGVYTVDASQLNTNISLAAGTYHTVVQAWDNCGGVGDADVTITVAAGSLPAPRFVYLTEHSNGQIGGYLVNPQNGQLSSTGQPPVWAHWGPCCIASDSGGYRLYVANEGSSDVSAYFINRNNGYLTAVPGANFPTGGWGSNIVVHPSNAFVYVTTINSTGVGSNTISGFSVASNGSLVPVPGSPYMVDQPLFALAINPGGQYLYASNGAPDVFAYSINRSTGALTALPGSPLQITPAQCTYCNTSYDEFNDMKIDHTGKYLIAPGYTNGVIYVEAINASTGALTPVSGSPFDDNEISCPIAEYCSGGTPTSLTVDATNAHVIVMNTIPGANDIVTYQFNAATGALTKQATTPPPYGTFYFGESGESIRADPSGQFVYGLGFQQLVGQSAVGAMTGYQVNQTTGSLTEVPNAPYPSPGNQNSEDGLVVTP